MIKLKALYTSLQVLKYLSILIFIVFIIILWKDLSWNKDPFITLIAGEQLIFYCLYFFGLLLLVTNVIKNVKSGLSITTDNLRYLKYVGLLTVSILPFSILFNSLQLLWYPMQISGKQVIAHLFSIQSLSFFFLGILIYVIGFAMAEGIRLKQENELTI